MKLFINLKYELLLLHSPVIDPSIHTDMLASSISVVALYLLLAWLSLAAAASESADPPPVTAIGIPGCTTICGNVSVPYLFGMGPPRCYMPGFFPLMMPLAIAVWWVPFSI
jgi:hypothetical protein